MDEVLRFGDGTAACYAALRIDLKAETLAL
jgi:hypothetical protein